MVNINNMFKRHVPSDKSGKGFAGYDNIRENIDPHVKTKVLNTKDILTSNLSGSNIIANNISGQKVVGANYVSGQYLFCTEGISIGNSAVTPSSTAGLLYLYDKHNGGVNAGYIAITSIKNGAGIMNVYGLNNQATWNPQPAGTTSRAGSINTAATNTIGITTEANETGNMTFTDGICYDTSIVTTDGSGATGEPRYKQTYCFRAKTPSLSALGRIGEARAFYDAGQDLPRISGAWGLYSLSNQSYISGSLLLSGSVILQNSKLNQKGGFGFYAKAGQDLSGGHIVTCARGEDGIVKDCGITDGTLSRDQPVGIVGNSVISGSMCYVITNGIAEVYSDGTAAISGGDFIQTSGTQSGEAISSRYPASPADANHWRECGHALTGRDAVSGAGLFTAVIHFN